MTASDHKIRVLLLSVNREQTPQPVYPLGLEYIRAACKGAGFETLILDCNLFSDVEAELKQNVSDFQPDFSLISLRNIDSIESVDTKFYVPAVVEAVAAIRAASTGAIILGGSGFSLFPAEVLECSGADYGVVGAGEEVIAELLRSLSAGSDISGIAGLVYRDPDEGDKFIVNKPLPPKQSCIIPERSEELINFYWKQGGQINIQMKRGCPYRCIYCTYPALEGKKVISREVESVVDEMEMLYNTYGVDQFFMVDNVLNIRAQTVDQLAREIIRRKLKVRWTGYFMPRGVTNEAVRLWKEAGLQSIEFGVDTLAPLLFERYKKDFSLQDVKQAAHACAKAKVPYSVFLILGGPGETQATVEESITECQNLPDSVIFILIGMRIYPGTEIYRIALSEGYITEKQDLLKPCFYIAPDLDRNYLQKRLDELGKLPNWCIVGHGWEDKQEMAMVLRKSGRKGSLWEYCQT